MATITGLTAERMLEIENESIVQGAVNSDGDLILTKFDGTTINAGRVLGLQGPQGPQGDPGVAGISSIPGEIKAWPNTVLPVQATYGKWVWADGAVYSAASYPIAAGHIHANWKTAYGQSDPGAGNFRVPDLRGLVLAGLDQMPGGARANRMTRSVAITIVGKTGEETHVVTVAEMPSHSHGAGSLATGNDTPDHTHGLGGSVRLAGTEGLTGATTPWFSSSTVSATGGASARHTHPISGSTNSQGSGGAHENVQPTVFVPYIVRLDG